MPHGFVIRFPRDLLSTEASCHFDEFPQELILGLILILLNGFVDSWEGTSAGCEEESAFSWVSSVVTTLVASFSF